VSATRVGGLGRAGPLVATRFASAIISTAIPLVLARVLDLAAYGAYKQIFLVTQTLFLVLPFGMVQGLYYFVPRTDSRRPLYAAALAFLGLASVIAGVGVLLGAPLAGRVFGNPELVQLRESIAIYLVGLLLSSPLEISLTAEGRIRSAAGVYLVSDTLRAAVMVTPVLLGQGLVGVMHALAAFYVLRSVLAVTWLLRHGAGPLWERDAVRAQLRYAAPFGASVIVSRPAQYAHQYVVSALASTELFAVYSVGCFQLPFVDLLYTPTSEVLMVRLGELDRAGELQRAPEVFRAAAARLAYFFVPLAVLLAVAAPELIAALFGVRYLGAVPLFRVSVLGVLLSILPIDGALRSRGFTRHILIAALVRAGLAVPLALLGVRHFGLMGGLGSWAMSELLSKLVLAWKLPAALGVDGQSARWRSLMPWRELGRAMASSVVGAAAAVLAGVALASLVTEPAVSRFLRIVPLLVRGLAFGVAYLGALALTGVDPLSLFIARPMRAGRAAAG